MKNGAEVWKMASVKVNRNEKNVIVSYRWRACLGRDTKGKQRWITRTVSPLGITPAKELREMRARADAWEKEQKTMVNAQMNPNMLFRDYLDQIFLPLHVESGALKPNTVASYSHMLPRCVEYFGNKKLSAINKADVEGFIVWLRKQKKDDGAPLSDSTVKHHFDFLRICLTFAESHELIAKNPTHHVPAPKQMHKDVDYLAPADAKTFILALAAETTRWQAIMMTLIYLGIRRGELCGLQWGDVDFAHNILKIRRNTVYTPKSGLCTVEPKTAKGMRELPMPKQVSTILQQWHKEQASLFGVTQMDATAFIFNGKMDAFTPLFPDNITKKVKKFMKKCGLPDYSPHDLRHTCGSLMLESGATVKMVQNFLGHKDPSTTLRFYAGTNAESLRTASNALSATLNAGKIQREDRDVNPVF